MDFYFDENIPIRLIEGLKILEQSHQKHTIFSTIDVFGRSAPDEDIIPGISERDGIFVTKDLRIQKTQAQCELLRLHKIPAFFLDPPKNSRYWDQVVFLIENWPKMLEVATKFDRDKLSVCMVKPRKLDIKRI